MQSQAETVRVLGDILEKQYGEQVVIKYVDVIEDDMDPYPEVEEYLKINGLKLPLLVIDGKIVRPGMGLNYMEIVEEIEDMGVKKLL